MCEYLIVIVKFCNRALEFLTQSRFKQIASGFMQSLDQDFSDFETGVGQWASLMNATVTALMAKGHIDSEQTITAHYNIFSSLMRDNRERQFEERRLRLLKKLSPSQDEFESIWRREQKKGSVNWVFQEDAYVKWKNDDIDGTLVITGSLGSGKTVLMANLVRDLYNYSKSASSSPVVASFFCQYRNKKTLVAEVIIGSLMHQIVRDLGIGNIDSDQTSMDIHAITDQLRFQLPKGQKCFIAIDALDECTAEEAKMVINGLANIADEFPLRIVLSCRNQSDLLHHQSGLSPLGRLSMVNPGKDEEISAFIDREIALRVGQGSLGAETEQRIKVVLTAAAHGMYLWVVLQLDTILPRSGELVSQGDIFNILENLPKDLDEAYNRALAKIKDKRYGSRLFRLAASALRPLTTKELAVALNITPGEVSWVQSSLVLNPDAIVWRCGGGLLEIEESDDTVHWIHHSALRHLLLNDTTGGAESSTCFGTFGFRLNDAQWDIGQTCVTYLNLDVHDRRIQRRNPRLKAEMAIDAINKSLPTDDWISKFMLSWASQPGPSHTVSIDINSVLEGLRQTQIQGQVNISEFLPYSQRYWMEHTKDILTDPHRDETTQRCQELFGRLFNPDIQVATKPWPVDSVESAIFWASKNDHLSVFYQFTNKDGGQQTLLPEAKSVVDWLAGLVIANPASFKLEGCVVSAILSWKAIQSSDEKDVALVEQLLCLGVGSNFSFKGQDGKAYTPLQFALQHAHLEGGIGSLDLKQIQTNIAELLLKHGADPNGPSECLSDTALYSAINNGWVGCAEKLIDAIPSEESSFYQNEVDAHGTTILGLVIERFQDRRSAGLKLMEQLFDKLRVNGEKSYYHPNHTDTVMEGMKPLSNRWPPPRRTQVKSPLFVTISYQWWEAALLLISKRINVDFEWEGVTPLGLATNLAVLMGAGVGAEVFWNFLDGLIARTLNKLRPSKTFIWPEMPAEPPLFIALRTYHTSRLLHNENKKISGMKRTLHFDNLLESLIYPCPHAVNFESNGLTALGMVTEWCQVDAMEMLLQKGADGNQPFRSSQIPSKIQVPLMALIENYNLCNLDDRRNAFALLLKYGASPNMMVRGETIHGHAIRLNDQGILKILHSNWVKQLNRY